MRLRQHLLRHRPPSWPQFAVLAAVAASALGLAQTSALAGVGNYSTLYLSATTSTVSGLGSSRELLTSAGPGAPTSAPTIASDSSGTALTGTYAYEYSVVDSTGGETAPSPATSTLTVSAKSIDVSGLPTGMRIRLYRECSCTSNLFYKVADFTPASSTPQFVDNVADATSDVAANLLPQSQNRPAVAATGYYEFVPGVPLSSTSATSTPVASPAFSGKGWVVDASGGVSIPSGTWTFTTKLIGKAGNGTARLDIGMWKVDSTGAVVGSAIIAPATTGENTTANIATVAGTASPIVTTIASVPAITLQPNEHLYVQFWRHQTAGSTGTPITTLLAYDGTAQITHPTANGFPNLPALGPTAARVNAPPQLSATFSDPDASDTGTLSFQLCSDSACNTVLQSGTSSSGIANGASGTWTPSTLSEGTYYWRAQATDSFTPTGNVSGWSATSSFIVDTTPPGVPTMGAPAAAARVNSSQLNATFVDSDSTDSGAVNFRVCTSSACTTVVTSGSSGTVAGGTAVSWTPGIADGTYYWQIRDQDVAGNQSAWTAAQSFVLDTNPPGVPVLSGPADGAYLGAVPSLLGGFSSSDTGDSGTVSFQVCSDAACTGVQASGSSASGLLNAATGSWTPSGLADGLHYWRARAQDAAGNLSAWSAARSFALDTTAPAVPPLGSVAARGKITPLLSATFSDPPATDSGSLSFQLCATSACTSPLQTDTATGVAGGATGSWTPASLADGLYYWRVRATDTAGNQSAWSAAASFTVDTVPPGLPAFVSPASAGRVNSSALSATFVDSDSTDSGTVTFQLCSDAACATVLSSSTSATVAGGTGVSWTPAGLADGTYYWRLSGLDVAGNQGAWTSTRSFVLDTNPPGVPALSGPADGAYLGAAPSLLGGFSSSDTGDSGTVSFQVCSDAACAGVQASGSSASGLLNAATGSWTPTGLADGLHYWRAQAQDAAGNLSAWSAARSFTLDTTAPAVPPLGSVAARGKITPQLSATFSDPPATDSGTITFQLCSSSSCTTVLQTGSASGVAGGATGSWTPASLADGLYFWRARATDAAANPSAWSAAASFTVDSTPPGLPALVSPASAARVSSVALSGTFVDSDSTDSGTVTFQLCSDAACATVLSSSTSATVVGGTGVSWSPTGLADGTYYWRLSGLDVAGNQGAWTSARSFVLDTNPPGVPALSGPADGAYLGAVPSLLGGFSSADTGDSGTVSFEVCSDAACATVQASGSSASGLLNGATGSWTPSGLADGLHYWRAQAQDAAGNVSAWSAARSFTFDTVAPSAPAPSAPAAGQLSNRPPTFAASYTSSTAGGNSGTVIFQICSSSTCASALQTDTVAGLQQGDSATWTPAGLADGTYHWRVRAEDLAGNLSGWTPTQSFTLDSTPPPTPVLATLAGAHVNTSPPLAGAVTEPSNTGDSVELLVELCSDQACGTVLGTSYTGFGPVGTALGWQPSNLADGTYYWRALAQDKAGNQSPWSAADGFVVDTRAPGVPAPSGPAVGAVVNKVLLRGSTSGSAVGGSIEFQVCKDPLCATVVALGIAPATSPNAAVTWAPTGLPNGSYFWRVSARDQAGNASAWSETMSFVLDQTPPPAPQVLKPVVKGGMLTLRWKAPAGDTHVAGYVLYVNGKRWRVLPATTHSLNVALEKYETRTFSIAAFDVPGEVGHLGRLAKTAGPRRL